MHVSETVVGGRPDEGLDRLLGVPEPAELLVVLQRIVDATLDTTDSQAAVLTTGQVVLCVAGTTLAQLPVRGGVTVSTRAEPSFGELTIARAADDYTPDQLRTLTALAVAIGTAIDNAHLQADAQRRERWLRASNEVITRVLAGAELDDVLGLIADRVMESTPADGVAIMLEESDGRMIVEYVAGDAAELFAGMVFDDEWSYSSQVIRTGNSIVLEDLGGLGRSDHPVYVSLGPCMLLPLVASQRTVGAIAVANYRGGKRFDDHDLALAEAFSRQAAVALVLDDTRRDRERLSLFEDRDRIARDLHDLVIQRLFATGMMLQGAARAEDPDSPTVQRVNDAVDELDATIREIRQTIFALHSSTDTSALPGLRARVITEISVAAPALGFTPHIAFVGAVDAGVNEAVAGQLVAALRESLSNVARHAQAARVDIEIGVRDDQVFMTVTDDGVGVAPGGRRSGLRNIALRAAGLGGWCSVAPATAEGKGTKVTWQVTVAPEV